MPRLRFAGQVTGVEGYVESAAMGLLTGRLAAAEGWAAAEPRRHPETPSAPWSNTSPAATSTAQGQLPADEHQLRPAAALEAPKVDEAGQDPSARNAAAPRSG
jgi:methylenetetrahydrofolate--tRNA-(uracil-5-)-methyltransferase